MSRKRFGQSGVVREMRPRKRRQFVPARELAEALAQVPGIDYEQLRADIDAVVDQDPTPRYWVD
ncbi:MAG TPA: hypothetical protein VK471_01640 [Solirubrobacterales bacterium]|nr:hypothetical protein [Solirubrobacterales bacterium]